MGYSNQTNVAFVPMQLASVAMPTEPGKSRQNKIDKFAKSSRNTVEAPGVAPMLYEAAARTARFVGAEYSVGDDQANACAHRAGNQWRRRESNRVNAAEETPTSARSSLQTRRVFSIRLLRLYRSRPVSFRVKVHRQGNLWATRATPSPSTSVGRADALIPRQAQRACARPHVMGFRADRDATPAARSTQRRLRSRGVSRKRAHIGGPSAHACRIQPSDCAHRGVTASRQGSAQARTCAMWRTNEGRRDVWRAARVGLRAQPSAQWEMPNARRAFDGSADRRGTGDGARGAAAGQRAEAGRGAIPARSLKWRALEYLRARSVATGTIGHYDSQSL